MTAKVPEPVQDAAIWIDEATEQIVERLREVVGIDTTVPPGKNYETLVDLLASRLEAFGFQTERVVVPPELVRQIPLPLEGSRTNLVARLASGNPGAETVNFYAHMDTVSVGVGWTTDPFGGEFRDGKVFGRGASDLKGSIVAVLTAMEALSVAGVSPKYDITVCFCTDEEIGGYPGVRYLAEQGYLQGHLYCLDGGVEPFVCQGTFGAVDVTITVTGQSCHSGVNFMGVNAIDELLPIMNELAELKRVVERRESAVNRMPHPDAPSNQLTPMLNFAVINGGVKSNIVPGSASLLINRRYIPEENVDGVVGEIRDAVERCRARSRAKEIQIDVFHLYPAMTLETTGPHTRRALASASLAFGYPLEGWPSAAVEGSSDMAFVQQVLGWRDIPMRGVERGDNNGHGADEFVWLNDVKGTAKEILYYLTME